MGCSTFAEYTVMPEIALAKVNREAPLAGACLFACGLSTGLGAAMNTAKVEAGSTCVVFGAGMVGLGAVAGCRLQGAERIVCVDLSEERLAGAGARRDRSAARGRRRGRGDPGADARFRRRLHVRGDGEREGDAAGGRGGADGLGTVHDRVPQLVERWLAGEIDVDSFLSHRLTLDDVNHGFELMEAQDGIRSVLLMGGSPASPHGSPR
jgi:S-(hydroxymethyl)glutathione dehydrogenase / alcohol dehydrogenase